MAGTHRDIDEHWNQDIIDYWLDVSFDRETSFRAIINSVGAITDTRMTLENWRRNQDKTWNSLSDAAAFVGEDSWSEEFKLVFGQPEIPRPTKGTLWSVDSPQAVWDSCLP